MSRLIKHTDNENLSNLTKTYSKNPQHPDGRGKKVLKPDRLCHARSCSSLLKVSPQSEFVSFYVQGPREVRGEGRGREGGSPSWDGKWSRRQNLSLGNGGRQVCSQSSSAAGPWAGFRSDHMAGAIATGQEPQCLLDSPFCSRSHTFPSALKLHPALSCTPGTSHYCQPLRYSGVTWLVGGENHVPFGSEGDLSHCTDGEAAVCDLQNPRLGL